MTHRRASSGEEGVAMLEFVLVLPFIWVVMALSLNFALGFMERQRALVAVREFGLRTNDAVAAGSGYDSGAAVRADTLSPRRMNASMTQSDDTDCPRGTGGGVADEGGILAKLDSFVGRISRTHVYQTSANGQQLTGRLLPRVTYQTCLAIDSNPWTHREVAGYSQLIGGPLGWILNKIGL